MLTQNDFQKNDEFVSDAHQETHSSSIKLKRPNVFDYVDYRLFLKDMLHYKKSLNQNFSENAFIFSAGFGKNSRGYFGLITKGKRNLTSKSIIGFSNSMALAADESIYFENMVLFNQAEDEKEKYRFFERMKVGANGKKARIVNFLEHQYRYLNEWHIVVLLEMVTLTDFKEDPEWIRKKLGGKITKEKVIEGLNDLVELGLLSRNAEGKLVQSEPVVIFEDNAQNFKNSYNLHKHFALRAADAMENVDYDKRAAQLITLCLPRDRFEELRREMKEFTKKILREYQPATDRSNNMIVQLGSQLINISEDI